MPEGTLNRTFCLSKIHFFLFLSIFSIFWPKKCHFDEILKTQMPEGTLNRTFCLPKINFSSFFALLGIFWQKNCNCLAFLAFFGHFWQKNIPKPDFIEIFEKNTPKTRFYRNLF